MKPLLVKLQVFALWAFLQPKYVDRARRYFHLMLAQYLALGEIAQS